MLRTRARRLKRQHGLDLIVLDYLQLMRGSGSRGSENRVQEISEITRGLKAIAKELDVPVLALSQLSRAVEQRDDKRPQLSDLRESGSIEQDADVVMFVYREQYYHERAEPNQRPDEDDSKFHERRDRWMKRGEEVHNMADVIVAKQRHGPIGTGQLLLRRHADALQRSRRRRIAARAVRLIDRSRCPTPRRRSSPSTSPPSPKTTSFSTEQVRARDLRRGGEGGCLWPGRRDRGAGAAPRGLRAFLRGDAGRGAGAAPDRSDARASTS